MRISQAASCAKSESHFTYRNYSRRASADRGRSRALLARNFAQLAGCEIRIGVLHLAGKDFVSHHHQRATAFSHLKSMPCATRLAPIIARSPYQRQWGMSQS